MPPAEISVELGRNQSSAMQLDDLVARVDAKRGIPPTGAEAIDAAHRKKLPYGVPPPPIVEIDASKGPPPPPPEHAAELVQVRGQIAETSRIARGLEATAQGKARAHRGEWSTTASSMRQRTGDRSFGVFDNDETSAYATADAALKTGERSLAAGQAAPRAVATADPANDDGAVLAIQQGDEAVRLFAGAPASRRRAVLSDRLRSRPPR